MNLEIIIFYIFSLLLLSSSIAVIMVNNPVKSAISLVLSFFSSAVLWLLLNAEFLSIILILVYVGAVMVLFLFVVMMLDINISRTEEGFVKYLPIGIIVFATIAGLLSYFFYNQFDNAGDSIITSIDLIGKDNTKNLGYLLYTEYLLAFEIAAIILLLGIISAITLTHKKSETNKYQNPGDQVNVSKNARLKIISDEDRAR
ncbi:MAG: NADH-quinone oxidoreductase subunit J [Gammaproteobacteria bacterium]|jgi:NADH-quinone oxidoreductase subunit J|nr:NADH-quinone oxidoreductase subunit J [Gammaproteobacteria bacterium]MBT4462958.1 NADH-quinone oxidoreductase subunit J [Gammaproteobacteria bacterium]MBT4654619.1 NADH-quinone oxidoreductase subunit J [Gammaproteobacteria bacterium]MBT5117070.1 NADH-quinone oxidoreductase subunit J [Gammaproteobacteria bacterium]MBT5761305.1 NADH-quinone oxidoreductase subunit J [Gammaproteobacteria bacterium]